MEKNLNTPLNDINSETTNPREPIVSSAQQPFANQTPQDPNPIATPPPEGVFLGPTSGQIQVGMSASQMGYNEPKKKLFNVNPKKLILKGVIALTLLVAIFGVLLLTNVITLSEFKSVSYTNSSDTDYRLDFYAKYGSKQLRSGNTQLLSKISKGGKFPIALSISTTDEMSGYNRTKDCIGFVKVFDVQNDNLDQKISVCDFGKQGSLPAGGVYIAGFLHNDKAHIITIGQDYGDIDLSSQSGAQQSLTRFGLDPYSADIERIVSSIAVE